LKKELFITSRLKIRNLGDADLDDFHYYRSNPEIAKYQGFEPFSKKEAQAFISDHKNKSFGSPGEWIQYGIELINFKRIVGDCAIKLQKQNPMIAEIGITISHQHQRQGYAKETLAGILNFLFHVKEIHRVVETTDAENTASVRLLKSLSFREEGYFLENIFFKGKWGSEYQFAMLRREWEELGLSNS
jgi:ribosomal-protein-alanine N-acetyltransferase